MKTFTTFKIADKDLTSFHSRSFNTYSEAVEVMNKEYTNRNEQDGHDDYWRSRETIVIKETKTIEILISNK